MYKIIKDSYATFYPGRSLTRDLKDFVIFLVIFYGALAIYLYT